MNDARKLSILFFAIALCLPIITVILTPRANVKTSAGTPIAVGNMGYDDTDDGPYIVYRQNRAPGKFGYDTVLGVKGGFVWRFFEWHIVGDHITDLDYLLCDFFGLFLASIINIHNPTLFHVFILFMIAALICWRDEFRRKETVPSDTN